VDVLVVELDCLEELDLKLSSFFVALSLAFQLKFI